MMSKLELRDGFADVIFGASCSKLSLFPNNMQENL